MKIVFAGGGSGGHFYPIIAVAEAVRDKQDDDRLIDVNLYYVSDSPYDYRLLFENSITYKYTPAGKKRNYTSILNFFDLFKTTIGICLCAWKLYFIYPDVVFGKGGYASFPTIVAARLLGIPVVIHESDSVPGRVNTWAGKFARHIAIAFPEAAKYFDESKIAVVGMPVRRTLRKPLTQGAHEFLGLDPKVPTILVLGGSQGAAKINDVVLDALPRLVEKYQIIHQVGPQNLADSKLRSSFLLDTNVNASRYHLHDFLRDTALRMAAGVADLVISRAGATSLFEIAQWGKPSIIIPISNSVGDHQRTNAYSYAKHGCATVVQEENLTANILISELERIMESTELRDLMAEKTRDFATPDAARKIADDIVSIALEHEH